MFNVLLLLSFLFLPLFAEEKNDIIVCENSLEMFAWDMDFLLSAEQSIELGAYIFEGKIFDMVFENIEKRLKAYPQLQVYILCSPSLLQAKERDVINRFSKNYPGNFHLQFTGDRFVSYPDSANIENHMKFLVVDEKYFSVGGTNFSEKFFSEGTKAIERDPEWNPFYAAGVRDQDIVGRGPLAKKLRQMFHKTYALWEKNNTKKVFEINPEAFATENHYFALDKTKQPKCPRFDNSKDILRGVGIEMIISGPMDKPNKITKEYENLILSAKKDIAISNMFFMPVSSLYDALIKASKEGKIIQIITNGDREGAPRFCELFSWANRMHYLPLFCGRSSFSFWQKSEAQKTISPTISIYEYAVSDVFYHKKVMVIDRQIVLIGSYNLGRKSDLYDYELIVKIDSKEAAELVLKILERDKMFSIQISSKQALEWYFDPLKNYLGALQNQVIGGIY